MEIRIGLLSVLRLRTEVTYPELYLKASGELLLLCIAIVWPLTVLMQPEFVESNPIKARMGYNNACVGFDLPPGRYVACPMLACCLSLIFRYAWLDMKRTSLVRNRLSSGQFWMSMSTDVAFMVSGTMFSLVLVVDPGSSAWGHTVPFLQFVVVRVFIVAANTFEHPEPPRPSLVFLAVYAMVSALFLVCVVVNFAGYDAAVDKASHEPTVPVGLAFSCDVVWFVCLGLTTCFLPQAEEIRMTYSVELPSRDRNVQRYGFSHPTAAIDRE